MGFPCFGGVLRQGLLCDANVISTSLVDGDEDDGDRDQADDQDDDYGDIYIMMSVCLSEKSSLLGFSWFLVGFYGF